MHAYARAMRTNRPARPARPDHLTHRPRHLGRPGLAPVLAVAAVAVALTALVTAVVVALACYLAGGPGSDHRPRAQSQAVSTSQLIGPTVGRGAGSATCRHAPRSPRCLREGGTAAVVRDPGAARPVSGGDDQTVLIGGEGARPAEVPGRAPGRGGWVGEEGPSRA